MRSSIVDAVVAVGEVSLELARELARFEPCGYGNPGVNLLVPGAQLMGLQGMGEGGKHLRLQVADASAHCGAVAWGRGGDVETLHTGTRHDVVCRLEINDWRGALAPRLVLRDIVPWPEREPVEPAPAARLGAAWPAAAAGEPVPLALAERAGRGEAALAALAGGGQAVVVLVADVERRLATLPDPRRYGARQLADLLAPRATPRCSSRRSRSSATGAVAVADHHSFARLRGPARARGARARARPARAPRGARGAGRGPRARADRRRRARRRLRARLRRGRCAARRHGRALARRGAGRRRRRSRSCARGQPGPTCRRPPTSSTRRVAALAESGVVELTRRRPAAARGRRQERPRGLARVCPARGPAHPRAGLARCAPGRAPARTRPAAA